MEFHPIQRLKEHLKKLKNDLKPMSFGEKLDHLWTYYKWLAALVALIIMLICMVVTSIININTETLLSGMIINTDISLEGNNYLTTDYFSKLQGREGKEEIELTRLNYMDPEETTDIEFSYTAVMRIIAQISARQLDYVITDEVGMETCMDQDALMDLREILTEQELLLLEDDLIYLYYDEDDVTVPVAVNLRNHPFYERYIQAEDDRYLAFVANTPRMEACRDFWDYLLAAGETE